MSCITKIKNAYDSLTTSEQKIANYIINNSDDVITKSVHELAEYTKVSAAAWVRFSKKIGYQGIKYLKLDLASAKNDENDIKKIINSNHNQQLDKVTTNIENLIINNVSQTYGVMDFKRIEETIRLLTKSRNIYLLGVGGSSIVCKDFLHKLTRIGYNVIHHDDMHIMLQRIAHSNKNDVVIAVSYSGNTSSVNYACKIASKNKTKVIAITKYDTNSELSKLADIRLFTPSSENELRIGSMLSRNSALLYTDILYLGLYKSNDEMYDEFIIKTKEILKG